jgi:hypothetical protein
VKEDWMKRKLFGTLAMAVIILAATGVASQSALGQASPNQEGTLKLTVPTATCAGFAAGDTLTFDSVAYAFTLIRTWVEPDNPYGEIRYMYRLRGTTTAGGYTYTLRATTHFVGDQLFAGNFAPSAGEVTIKRSDGRTLTGKASVHFDIFDPDGNIVPGQFWLTWLTEAHAQCR